MCLCRFKVKDLHQQEDVHHFCIKDLRKNGGSGLATESNWPTGDDQGVIIERAEPISARVARME
jgi:hypothetical protein